METDNKTQVINDSQAADILTKETVNQVMVAVFHDHSTMLETYWDSVLRPVMRALGPNPFESPKNQNEINVHKVLEQHVTNLFNSLQIFITKINFNWQDNSLRKLFSKLRDSLERLSDYKNDKTPKSLWFPFLRECSRKIIDALDKEPSVNIITQEQYKIIIANAKEIERLVCLYDLTLLDIRLMELKQDAVMLKDLFISNLNYKKEKEVVNFSSLVRQACMTFKQLGDKKGVEIRIKNDHPNINVFVHKKDIQRSINGIISNAIKYSWTLSQNNPAWVNISSWVENKFIYLRVESWGVPLMEPELKENKVFEFGYRGIFSDDQRRTGSQRRTGTGIGLWDARKMIEEHGGAIYIVSRTAGKIRDDKNYEQPYITTVSLRLPIYYGK